ncbi:hypothetical protein SHKM778_26930 [Streptomyces sp. KM77-8]|uniref:DUF6299 domain-containing protein n=1 Tax=Streptomyces haneummycinicus TaxID=3074435 RepID=A0AAT9HGL1_9ACTN
MRRRGAPLGEHRVRAPGTLKAGKAHVEATLMEMRPSGIVLLPIVHAVEHRNITLVED